LRVNPNPKVRDYDVHNELADHARQLNLISEGRIFGVTNRATAIPTTGLYEQGDFIRNATPLELGVASSKYIIHGWQCVLAGEPGTWVECRYLTGN
jgi:hypothetical protein